MAASMQDHDEIISGINVTPLVDIVLVILIIFIMTASVIFKSGIPMDLPQAQTAEEKAAGLLNLGISEAGVLYINGERGPQGSASPAQATACKGPAGAAAQDAAASA